MLTMKAPYFEVTAVCRNERCDTDLFTQNRKKVDRLGTDGRKYRTQNLVCPECRQWADVTGIKMVDSFGLKYGIELKYDQENREHEPRRFAQ